MRNDIQSCHNERVSRAEEGVICTSLSSEYTLVDLRMRMLGKIHVQHQLCKENECHTALLSMPHAVTTQLLASISLTLPIHVLFALVFSRQGMLSLSSPWLSFLGKQAAS